MGACYLYSSLLAEPIRPCLRAPAAPPPALSTCACRLASPLMQLGWTTCSSSPMRWSSSQQTTLSTTAWAWRWRVGGRVGGLRGVSCAGAGARVRLLPSRRVAPGTRQRSTTRALPPPPRPPRPPRAAVGPSITLAAACEVAAFALGGLTSMPALQAFSLTAAAAVGLDFVLQVTAFVALLALDTARREG